MSVDLVVDEVDGLEPETITPADRLQIDDIPVFDYRIYRAESALADKLLPWSRSMTEGRHPA